MNKFSIPSQHNLRHNYAKPVHGIWLTIVSATISYEWDNTYICHICIKTAKISEILSQVGFDELAIRI
jgi:hypothetical protein